jgi:hypothetical protein
MIDVAQLISEALSLWPELTITAYHKYSRITKSIEDRCEWRIEAYEYFPKHRKRAWNAPSLFEVLQQVIIDGEKASERRHNKNNIISKIL